MPTRPDRLAHPVQHQHVPDRPGDSAIPRCRTRVRDRSRIARAGGPLMPKIGQKAPPALPPSDSNTHRSTSRRAAVPGRAPEGLRPGPVQPSECRRQDRARQAPDRLVADGRDEQRGQGRLLAQAGLQPRCRLRAGERRRPRRGHAPARSSGSVAIVVSSFPTPTRCEQVADRTDTSPSPKA